MFVGKSRDSDEKYENEYVSRKSFDEELARIYKGRGGTKPEWTKERVIHIMGMIESHKTQDLQKPRWLSASHYHYGNNYDVIKKGEEKILIMKRKKETDPAVQMVPSCEYYDILSEIHNNNKHAGRDKMLLALKSNYIIPKPVLDSFLRLCKFCRSRKAPPRTHLNPVTSYKSRKVIQETETMDTNRGRIDFIDLECTPDGDFRWILHYQENLTKFSFLRPIVLDNEIEVAMELLKIFLEVGCPAVLESSNGPDFTEKVISTIMDMWPSCMIKNASSAFMNNEESIQSLNDVEKLIQIWMKENNSINWATGIYFIQYQKNCAFHKGVRKTPFKALLNRDPINSAKSIETELSSDLPIPDDVKEMTIIEIKQPANSNSKKHKGKSKKVKKLKQTLNNKPNENDENIVENQIIQKIADNLEKITAVEIEQPLIYVPLVEDPAQLIEQPASSDSNNVIHMYERSKVKILKQAANNKPDEKNENTIKKLIIQDIADNLEKITVVGIEQPSIYGPLVENPTKLLEQPAINDSNNLFHTYENSKEKTFIKAINNNPDEENVNTVKNQIVQEKNTVCGIKQPTIYGPLVEDSKNLIETAFSSNLLILDDLGELTEIGQLAKNNSKNIIHINKRTDADTLKVSAELAVNRIKQSAKQPYTSLDSTNSGNLIKPQVFLDLHVPDNLGELTTVDIEQPDIVNKSFLEPVYKNRNMKSIQENALEVPKVVVTEHPENTNNSNGIIHTDKNTNRQIQKQQGAKEKIKQKSISTLKSHINNNKTMAEIEPSKSLHLNLANVTANTIDSELTSNLLLPENLRDLAVIGVKQSENFGNPKSFINDKVLEQNINKVGVLEQAAKIKRKSKDKLESQRKQKKTDNFEEPMILGLKHHTKLNCPNGNIDNNKDVGTNKEICEKTAKNKLKSKNQISSTESKALTIINNTDKGKNKEQFKQTVKNSHIFKDKSEIQQKQKQNDSFIVLKQPDEVNNSNCSNDGKDIPNYAELLKQATKNVQTDMYKCDSKKKQKKVANLIKTEVVGFENLSKDNNYISTAHNNIVKVTNEETLKHKSSRTSKNKHESQRKQEKSNDIKESTIGETAKVYNLNMINHNKKYTNDQAANLERKIKNKSESHWNQKKNENLLGFTHAQIKQPVNIHYTNKEVLEQDAKYKLCNESIPESETKRKICRDFKESAVDGIKKPTDVISSICITHNNTDKKTTEEIVKQTAVDKRKTNKKSESKTKGKNTANAPNSKSFFNIEPNEHILEQDAEYKRKRKSENISEFQSNKKNRCLDP